MRATILFALHSFALCTLLVASAQAQEPVKPGSEHEHFKQFAGAWDAKGKSLAEAGEPAYEFKGVMTYKVDHGGLWLVSDFRTDDFSGHGVTGFDPIAKKYTGIWIDSMNPSMMRSEGTLDKSGKILTEMADAIGPDKKPMKLKLVTEVKGPDAHTFTMYRVASDGKAAPMMLIEYARKK